MPRNSYLGAARNAAARLARGEWLFFMDDDNVAKPQMLAAFARAAAHSGADVLTCVNHKWKSPERPPQPAADALLLQAGDGSVASALTEGALDAWGAGAAEASAEGARGEHWLPLGPCVELGAHLNCFGDAHVLLKRAAFEAVGGYTEDFGLGLEDWELYANLALRAAAERRARAEAADEVSGAQGAAQTVRATMPPVHHLVIPCPLYWYRLSTGGGMLARQHADSPEARAQRLADRLRSMRPYVEHTWGGARVDLMPWASAGEHGLAADALLREGPATPSLEALLLYSESLRGQAAPTPPCAVAGTFTSLASVGWAGALVLLIALLGRRLARGWRDQRLYHGERDRSV
ncbi:hypothetical protein T492DRAFT_1052542 [Pavlovales sp. CCMP2436]|nr:hypothetical protein T492DRAFT_1052542 [Pavlovales sp. CCMP2436]